MSENNFPSSPAKQHDSFFDANEFALVPRTVLNVSLIFHEIFVIIKATTSSSLFAAISSTSSAAFLITIGRTVKVGNVSKVQAFMTTESLNLFPCPWLRHE